MKAMSAARINRNEEFLPRSAFWIRDHTTFVHQPPLDPTANYTQPQDPDGLKRVRRSWEYLTANNSIGLNFSTVRKTDDSQGDQRMFKGPPTRTHQHGQQRVRCSHRVLPPGRRRQQGKSSSRFNKSAY